MDDETKPNKQKLFHCEEIATAMWCLMKIFIWEKCLYINLSMEKRKTNSCLNSMSIIFNIFQNYTWICRYYDELINSIDDVSMYDNLQASTMPEMQVATTLVWFAMWFFNIVVLVVFFINCYNLANQFHMTCVFVFFLWAYNSTLLGFNVWIYSQKKVSVFPKDWFHAQRW